MTSPLVITRRPKTEAQPLPPTLRLDSQRAWRQGEDAVFLPIVYDLTSAAHRDTTITSLDQPSPSLEVLSPEEKRKNLASLKRKAETRDFRAPKQDRKNWVEVDLTFADAEPMKSKHLSISVSLLLFGVLALVFFAWMAFR